MIIFYEDIVDDPEAVCKRLFDVCKLNPDFIPLALEALKADSQRGLFVTRGKKPSVPKNDEDCANAMFAECRLPITWEMSSQEFRKFILSGTYELQAYEKSCTL